MSVTEFPLPQKKKKNSPVLTIRFIKKREKQKQIVHPVQKPVRSFILLVVYYYYYYYYGVVKNLAQAGEANVSRLQDTITPGYLATLLHGPACASLRVM